MGVLLGGWVVQMGDWDFTLLGFVTRGLSGGIELRFLSELRLPLIPINLAWK